MSRAALRPLVTALAIAAAAVAALSQTAPPIKPGLWQIHTEREVNGQKMPDASERMKTLSPEKRAQIEAMMKQHGIAAGAGGVGQVCYTRESLERSPWAEHESDCKTSFSSHSGSAWKWHTTCPGSSYEGDSEAIFSDHENYTIKSTSVMKMGDKVRNSRSTITGKWLSADCGGLKPLDAKP